MTLAEIIAEADALEAQVQSAIDLRMPTLADESIARRDAFRAEHFPRLVAVAEAAVERDETRDALLERLPDVYGDLPRSVRRLLDNYREKHSALMAALRGEGQKP